jgi:molecular chaperone HtpG
MPDTNHESNHKTGQPITFKAETRQLLNILVHSLYTERDIFLRELISNASDALTRVDFEILTNRNVLDPDAKLEIRVIPNPDENTLTIRDTGIGMTAEELSENLGTIAHSGARAFVEAAQQGDKNLTEIIGQFGVGFYSAFMVAEWIRVTSRSYLKEAQAASWYSDGSETFTVESTDKETRGTEVVIKLKDDAKDYTQEFHLREIIRKHSDFVSYPIFIGEQEEQVNRQTALWRQNPRQVEEKEYEDFYQQLTLDFEKPITHAHMVVDAPVQMYALLYVPSNPERGMFSARKQDGLKLYSRKILIQEYCKDLLPEYLNFVQGVVDSEDLPLNVSRESVQANKIMANLKKLVTTKVIDTLKDLTKKDLETYAKFWEAYARYIKQGVAIEQNEPEGLYPLLRFHTTAQLKSWSSLDDYISRMKPGQEDIYYIMGDDERSVIYSPHLDIVKPYDYEVLLLTDPLDAFMLVRLNKYLDHSLSNVATADLKPSEKEAEKSEEPVDMLPKEDYASFIDRFKTQLGERVSDVRMTERLSDSPARLVDIEGAPNQEMQRVYRLLNKEFEVPKKVLELNPKHPIMRRLYSLNPDNSLNSLIIEQVYENALLIEGLHPDPASMISRIQKLIEAALE